MREFVCSECKKISHGKVVDEGIGPYEYQGMKGVDVNLCLVSECCEAPLLDDKGKEVYYGDQED